MTVERADEPLRTVSAAVLCATASVRSRRREPSLEATAGRPEKTGPRTVLESSCILERDLERIATAPSGWLPEPTTG